MQSLDKFDPQHAVSGSLELAESRPTVQSIIFDQKAFENVQRIAEVMANSNVTVPKHLQKNLGDCMAVTMQALVWGMNPWPVAQKTHLVNGTLGYEAQLVNAVLQSSGAIKGRPHYEHRGDGNTLETRVGCVIAGEDEITWNEWLKSSDITTKNSPLWKTNPKLQMSYLQLKNWSRLYCPGAILGIYTVDELQEIDITPPSATSAASPSSRTSSLKDKVAKAKGKGTTIEGEKVEVVEVEPAQSVEDQPSLWQTISAAIDNAQSSQQLNKAIADVEKLNDEEKAKARFAYKYRDLQLKGVPVSVEIQEGTPHIVNSESGEVIY